MTSGLRISRLAFNRYTKPAGTCKGYFAFTNISLPAYKWIPYKLKGTISSRLNFMNCFLVVARLYLWVNSSHLPDASSLIFRQLLHEFYHSWALTPISVSAFLDWAWYQSFRYRTEEIGVSHYIGYEINFYLISDIRHPKHHRLAQRLRSKALASKIKGLGIKPCGCAENFLDIRYWNGFRCRYWNDCFQSDIFFSDIGLTDDDVRCRISPTSRSMSMPTYEHYHYFAVIFFAVCWNADFTYS